MKTGRPSKLTPALAAEIAQRIKLGAFPSVAAGSVGIAAGTYFRWMREGRRRGGRAKYRKFRHMVEQATAHARAMAEMTVARTDPRFWLSCGPGKEDWSPHARVRIDIGPAATEGTEPPSASPAPNFIGQMARGLEATGLMAITDQGRAMLGEQEAEEDEPVDQPARAMA